MWRQRNDPRTETEVYLYEAKKDSTVRYGIARRVVNSNNWEYFHPKKDDNSGDGSWSSDEMIIELWPSFEEADKTYRRYVDLYLRLMGINIPVTRALLVDPARKHIKFKCPHCHLIHYHQKRTDSTLAKDGTHHKYVCPKTKCDLLIEVIEGKGKFVCPEGSIPDLPNYYCQDCWGSGEYVGFTSVERCQSCFGKK